LDCIIVTDMETKLDCIIKPLSSMCLWAIFRITFSNSLPVVDKVLITLKFEGILGP
jgi:hypothetical protein